MPVKTKIIIGIIMIALLAGSVYWYLVKMGVGRPGGDSVACTTEAKLCPDGSYVGRVPPSCEFASCPGATSTAQSGIRGVVLLGPTCPVERIPPDPNCAEKSYATLIAIFRANDPVHAVAVTQSDASGTFSIPLPPGDYAIGAGESNLPRCAQAQVTVPSNAYATTTIRCDTGIR